MLAHPPWYLHYLLHTGYFLFSYGRKIYFNIWIMSSRLYMKQGQETGAYSVISRKRQQCGFPCGRIRQEIGDCDLWKATHSSDNGSRLHHIYTNWETFYEQWPTAAAINSILLSTCWGWELLSTSYMIYRITVNSYFYSVVLLWKTNWFEKVCSWMIIHYIT